MKFILRGAIGDEPILTKPNKLRIDVSLMIGSMLQAVRRISTCNQIPIAALKFERECSHTFSESKIKLMLRATHPLPNITCSFPPRYSPSTQLSDKIPQTENDSIYQFGLLVNIHQSTIRQHTGISQL